MDGRVVLRKALTSVQKAGLERARVALGMQKGNSNKLWEGITLMLQKTDARKSPG